MAWQMGGMERGGMEMGAEMAMPQMQSWGAMDLLLLFLMWAVMMVAMMLPSAAPMVLMFASIQRRRRERSSPYVSTAVFALGYLLIWSAYAALAALAQWGLHEAALLSPMMVSTSAILGGSLLIAAGLFQFTPLKHLCLTQCRSPLGFLSTEWREGMRGALLMGVRHGTYCVGCCWILMALLFVAGVMNLLWVAAIAGFVLLEKIVPRGAWVSRAAGVFLVGWGLWMTAVTLG
ncbi:MAG TPA: DUF2182 domain-containing protein [Chloroflexota bacterium]|nr:DUF2182 domain-containing protein [Chloroflexota bacterium]